MSNIHLVGLGALGLQLSVEIAKRAAATERDLTLYLYDFDTVEARNIFSQGFSPSDVGKTKAEVAGMLCSFYKGVTTEVRPWKLDSSNIKEMQLDSESIVIDAVDNLPTRHLLWGIGATMMAPVLHAGMSYMGGGEVAWNWGEYDNFTLSPNNLSPEFMAEMANGTANVEEVKLPPCDLNQSRSLALNTVHSCLDSLWIFLGQDFTDILPMELNDLKARNGVMTTWKTSITQRNLCLTSKTDVGFCRERMELQRA